MAEILIGIPRANYYKPFLESLPKFLTEVELNHKIRVVETFGKNRDAAREEIVQKFLEGTEDYLLFLDDDHSGHKLEMLESLLSSNSDICALKCFARHYPYQVTIYPKDKKLWDNYNTEQLNTPTSGYIPCELVGFGMTLIKRSVFQKLQPPFFVVDKDGEREDNYFCQKANEANLTITGCFDYTLDHVGINESNVLTKRKSDFRDFAVKSNRRQLLSNYLKYAKEKNIKLSEDQCEQLFVMKLETELSNEDFNVLNDLTSSERIN